MFVTYCKIGRKKTVIIGPTFDKKEDAEKFVEDHNWTKKNWTWVQVAHNDFTFAGYIT